MSPMGSSTSTRGDDGVDHPHPVLGAERVPDRVEVGEAPPHPLRFELGVGEEREAALDLQVAGLEAAALLAHLLELGVEQPAR